MGTITLWPVTTPDLRRSLRTAELLALGVTKGELRGPRWQAPYHGVHVPTGAPSQDARSADPPPEQRILEAAELVPPGGALAGWAAARLLGVPELDGRGRTGRDAEPVVVCVPEYTRHVATRAGVRFRRSRFDPGDVVAIQGLPVTNAVRTAFDLMRWSRPEDALVVGDLMARRLRVQPSDVVAYAESHRRLRGVPVVRFISPLIDPLSRSVGESRLRYLWVVDAGLPRPQCNPLVVDLDGSVVAMPDLLDPESGMVGEYDGSTHRELTEHTADNVREEDFESRGLVVVRATSLDLGRHRDRTTGRLRDGHRRASAASRDGPARWGWRPGRVWNPPIPPADW